MKRSHGKVVGTAVMYGKLFCEVIQREEGMGVIKLFLVFSVAAFHFAVMAWCVWADELVTYA